jgi:F-type H+-transporting ATPase subunit delta
VKLDPGTRGQISELIAGLFRTKVDLEEVVDPGIVGGFILRVDDSYIDASIKSKLKKIRKELSRSSLTAK